MPISSLTSLKHFTAKSRSSLEWPADTWAGAPHTAHTTNPVPCILVSEAFRGAKLRSRGRLCDLAPTLLEMMGLPKPPEMTGISLIGKEA